MAVSGEEPRMRERVGRKRGGWEVKGLKMESGCGSMVEPLSSMYEAFSSLALFSKLGLLEERRTRTF